MSCVGTLSAAPGVAMRPAQRAPVALGSSFVRAPVGITSRGAFSHSQISLSAGARNGSRNVTAMAKKVSGFIKLQIQAGKANPAPPIGPALGAQGVNIMDFCKQYNAATQDKAGEVIPVEITVFDDRSFTFILKTPPTSKLLLKAAGIAKGSGQPNKVMVGKVTEAQVEEIANIKMPDLNARDIEMAKNTVKGTAANMGIVIEG